MDTKKIAKRIVQESVVLLKNASCTLPFTKNQKAAFFGRAQCHAYYSGNGSGASRASKEQTILEECEKKGICPEQELKSFYLQHLAKEENSRQPEFEFSNMKNVVNSGIMYEIFGKYRSPEKEYEIPEKLLDIAKQFTDTAVLVIGRNSGGEECDRHLEEDYYLTASEKILTEQVCTSFKKVVLILNINGLIDLAWTQKYECIKSILFLGVCGEHGPEALAEILTGAVNPSGKLPVTIAQKYEDYPSADHFSWDKEQPDQILTYESYGLNAEENGSTGYDKSPVTVYKEGIYSGYRYFDTFRREPLFPFGFGLSYTEFEISKIRVKKEPSGLRIGAVIKNIGNAAGREVLQIYISAVDTNCERPYQELKGFEKTKLLAAEESEELNIFIPWKEMACYDEERAVYVIEKGTYEILAGSSSRETRTAARVYVEEDIITQRCKNRLSLRDCNRGKIEFLTKSSVTAKAEKTCWQADFKKPDQPEIMLNNEDVTGGGKEKDSTNSLPGEAEVSALDLDDFSIEELAALCVGYGPGTPFSAFGDGSDPETIFDKSGKPLTTNSHSTGMNGYVSPAMTDRGIQSVFYKDGPSGIGEISWPSEMLMACAFDRKLWRQFGAAAGYECEKQQVDIWLAPAVNLHRNPLCGRNFEYFSEDPYLTGVCACEITRGVQHSHRVLVCPKHFAFNEQETYRRGSRKKNYDAADSILTERAARELYLKPFEMLVKEAGVFCIMTSFNKINGKFAGGNADLCIGILREEWGFRGTVVTDWGDMDIVVDGADAVAAGNDIVMPGGPPVIAQIITGCQEGRVTRAQLEAAVGHLLFMIDNMQ